MKTIQLIASGDLRLVANQTCWPAQLEMERKLTAAIQAEGYKVERMHPVKEDEGHGFIASQREGMDIFQDIEPDQPLIVAEAVWQFSHHILAGLTTHRGPILTVANWSGQWPGLVGMLNLNGSLTKAGVKYSTLWSENFDDDFFLTKLRQWLVEGIIEHDLSHVQDFSSSELYLSQKFSNFEEWHDGNLQRFKGLSDALGKKGITMNADISRFEKFDSLGLNLSGPDVDFGEWLADNLREYKSIMGVFDEGCMGMFNAIIPDRLLHSCGVFKERLNQSALYHETINTPDNEAREVRAWLEREGMTFHTGTDPKSELTEEQIHLQCKMYIAAMRIADDFGCNLIGIQYQQGLNDLLPASDLVEGMLNNSHRPPVTSRDGSRILHEGHPLPHFNEVDECSGLDALLTHRIHLALGQPPETTLHDIRWGEDYEGQFIWVFLISGAAPPAHFEGGWKAAHGYRQPYVYFPNGGSTVHGISRPGEIIWSRIYVENEQLHMDIGRGAAVELPAEETRRRLDATTPQWPIMHAVTYGVSRDQMMAKHQANHIQVVYAHDAEGADRCLRAKAACAHALGIKVNLCGSF